MTSPGVTWAEYAAAMPDMAAAGQRLLYQFGPGLGYIATVRRDGGPRVHPVCPHIAEGELWIMLGLKSPKRHDLERDARYALHTFPKPDTDDEFYVTGEATRVDDEDVRTRVRASFISDTLDDDVLYRFTIERALLAIYETRPQWPPVYTRWRA